MYFRQDRVAIEHYKHLIFVMKNKIGNEFLGFLIIRKTVKINNIVRK